MTNKESESFEIFEQIASIVGEEGAFKVCEMFAGEQILFPKAILRLKRNYDIRKEFKAGASYRDLSIKYDLTTRQIRSICTPSNTDTDGQLDLFASL